MTPVAQNPNEVTPKRLWFGVVGSAVAWILAGLLDVLFAWQACMGGEAGSNVFTTTGLRILLGCITFGLLAVAIASGYVAYRNWRTLSDVPELVSAEGRGRSQFLGLSGLIVSSWLTMGIIWFSIPIYILGICVRPR